MAYKTLGNTGINVAPLAFGGNIFGWTVDEQQSFALLDAFTGAGFTLIDTADSYSRWKPGNQGGESETIIGNWVKQCGNRANVVIATKVGSDMGQGKNVTKDYILKAAEASLKRLQTDYIDLYQTHWDVEETPLEETLEAYSQLVQQGKVRHIGASNLSVKRFTDSLAASAQHGYPRYQTLQPLYNLYDREVFEKEFEAVCLQNNIGVISYFSLASGFLTGKYRSEPDLAKSARGQGNKKYLNERGFRILAALDEAAAEHNTTLASVALAWLIARPAITAPIASATTTEQLNDLITATMLELSEQTIEALDEASKWGNG